MGDTNQLQLNSRNETLRLTQRDYSNLGGDLIQTMRREGTVKEGFLEEVTPNCYLKDKQKAAR